MRPARLGDEDGTQVRYLLRQDLAERRAGAQGALAPILRTGRLSRFTRLTLIDDRDHQIGRVITTPVGPLWVTTMLQAEREGELSSDDGEHVDVAYRYHRAEQPLVDLLLEPSSLATDRGELVPADCRVCRRPAQVRVDWLLAEMTKVDGRGRRVPLSRARRTTRRHEVPSAGARAV